MCSVIRPRGLHDLPGSLLTRWPQQRCPELHALHCRDHRRLQPQLPPGSDTDTIVQVDWVCVKCAWGERDACREVACRADWASASFMVAAMMACVSLPLSLPRRPRPVRRPLPFRMETRMQLAAARQPSS